MDDETLPFEKTRDYALSRRGFAALSLGTVASVPAMAADAVTESDVVIRMADGSCDAALFHPTGGGHWPGIVIFADALGLRPAFRDMGRHLAAEGYTVIVPNPFYRTRKAPVLSGPFDFSKPEDRAKLVDLMAPLNTETKTCDGTTYVAYLARFPGEDDDQDRRGRLLHGWPLHDPDRAAVPERVAAGVSLHGANLVTDKPDSPHLLIPKLKASYYFGIAINDDQRQPDAKDKLREAFTAAHLPAKIEVYDGCQHGWCVSDGMVYNKVGAERAYDQEIALYKKVLV